MLMAMSNEGMVVSRLDPSGGFIDFVRSKGIACYQSLQELQREEKKQYDLIIHYYVYEHIRNPVEFLIEYMGHLASGGTMIFEVPCASDPLSELYKVPEFDRFYWSIAHHWYFTRESLSRVLEKTGFSFEIMPEQRYDISNHMVWMQDGKPGGYGRYADIFGSELDALYKNKLKDVWLCDTIVAVVHK
jgi:SAM-dependent methyltransferase